MSGGNKAVELQLQMQQNAHDLQSFMKDLESWETDMKRRDEELRTGGVQEVQKKLPPVRNKDYKTKKREKKKKTEPNSNGDAKAEETKQGSKIKAYDYRSWDKFDVDKALEEMDNEECHESNESDSEEAAVDQEKALAEKEKGNKFFKDGKYDEAVECYTRGMGADPYNPVLPTNRATSFFRLKKYAVAESDCNLAIALDGKYVKAYARRGAARFALKKYESALEDYEMVLKLDPGNVEAQNEVKRIREEAHGHQAATVQSDASLQEEAPTVDPDQQRLVEEQQRRQEAVLQKDRGNAYFKEGKYEAAVECYTRGMEADSMNVLLPANRAMAFLKLEKYKEAEEDCTKAISLDSTYSKAFARRGTARVALRKLEEAKQDFQQVLKLEPGNKQALNELQKLQIDSGGLLQTEESSQRRTVQPIDKPEHLRSTKPLRRINIEEVSGKVSVPEPVVQEAMKEAEDGSSPLSTSPSAKMIKIEEISDAPSLTCDQFPASKQTKEAAKEETVHPPEPPTAETDLPPPPSNSFQLEADLRKIGNQPRVIYRYLKQIEPEAYAKIFQNSLEPDILNKILRTLHEFYIENEAPAVAMETLSSLASVRRFDMAVMFMSSSEKKVLQELFEFLRRAELDASSVAALQKKYGV
ncbi:RNA polymerase II-associated protein 3 [Stegastes partitus]|uniref:RNA polymerase II-associated protein 3 n=1 Tax=Stegastes partitus TaxID=144197 RepID=A0A3B5AFG6_9TELE|nr:PREDICTED: RNA polymerase II-associated protein 3 [Stegastes partitus]XP_008282687.1 PREDICTED: RNA polymerase II-associated protein 3 [Stegastes partitus]XP_008282688.1 PREDICTED: RNA polymerase II-associated protein 3 [Stegastes partitus]